MTRQSARPLLLGHRGARARKSIPENTFASFDQALSDGCDGFEFDVRLTADDVGVVCHDPQWRGLSIERAYARELEGMPRLEEILTRYGERAFLDIELKVAGLERMVVEMLRRFPMRRGVVVSSFLPEVIEGVHRVGAQIPLGFIFEKRAEIWRWSDLPVDYVIAHHRLASEGMIREVHGAGKKIFVWTVNAVVEMRRFAGLGVDGIISDRTSAMGKALGLRVPVRS